MASTSKKKANVATSGGTASVQDLASEAGRNVEVAAILRAVWARIAPQFHADQGRLPALLLRRQGSGPRAAQTGSIVEAEVALETLAREFDARAKASLDLRVDIGDRTAPAPSEGVMFDEVIERAALEPDK